MHRERAAERLADDLRCEHKDYLHSIQIVVAHSHGGNLALRAFDGLAKNSLPLLVTLATPFVSVVATPLTAVRRQATTNVVLFGALFVTTALVSVIGASQFISAWQATVIGAFLAGLLVYLFGLHKNRKNEQRLIAATTTRNLLKYGSLQHLVLRSIDDEAALTLAAGAIGNRIALLCSYIITTLLSAIMVPYFVFAFFTITFGSFFPQLQFFVHQIPDFILLSIEIFAFGAPVVCIFLLVLSGAFKMVYGRELFLGTLQCAINSQSVPDNPGGD